MVCRAHVPNLVTLGLLLFAATGCAPAKPPSISAAPTQVATKSDIVDSPPPAKVTEEKDEPDPTLYPDEYEARGMPSIQNPWTLDDQQKAAVALFALAKENLTLLPRLKSKHSGSVFRRMVSRENLDIYANRAMDRDLRMSSLTALVKLMVVSLVIYSNAVMQGEPLDREMLEVMIYTLYLSALTWETTDEVATLMYRNDALLPQRLKGVEETQNGTAGILRGMITVLSDRQFVRLENHIWFASEFAKLLPRVSNRLTPEAHAEVEQRLRQLATTEPERELAKQLRRLHASLNEAKSPLVPRPANISTNTP